MTDDAIDTVEKIRQLQWDMENPRFPDHLIFVCVDEAMKAKVVEIVGLGQTFIISDRLPIDELELDKVLVIKEPRHKAPNNNDRPWLKKKKGRS